MRLEFDRGTLLLREVADDAEASNLPGVQWDPRAGASRAPAHRQAELLRASQAEGARSPGPARPADRPWRGGELATLELRPYQDAALGAWEHAGRRGLVVLPTGSGKTRVALAAIARCRARTLCLVPTRVLLEQWVAELSRTLPGPIGQYGDGVRELGDVTVATFESAYRHMALLGDRFELLVVDEAHHFGAGLRDEALEMAVAPWRLGLTATPPAGEAQLARLGELLGPVVLELGIADRAVKFLAPVDRIVLTLELCPDERRRYDDEVAPFREAHLAFRRSSPGAGWVDFSRAAVRTAEGRRALEAWRRSRRMLGLTRAKDFCLGRLLARHRDARVLVFTADNETAYAIARRHLVMPLTCDIGSSERGEALAAFRRGELRALVSARVLNEGLDVPEAEVAIVTGATMGEREHVQRVGRVLRPAPGKRAVVYELVTRRTFEAVQARRRRDAFAPRSLPLL